MRQKGEADLQGWGQRRVKDESKLGKRAVQSGVETDKTVKAYHSRCSGGKITCCGRVTNDEMGLNLGKRFVTREERRGAKVSVRDRW